MRNDRGGSLEGDREMGLARDGGSCPEGSGLRRWQ